MGYDNNPMIKHRHYWIDVTKMHKTIKREICKVCGRRREDGLIYVWKPWKWVVENLEENET